MALLDDLLGGAATVSKAAPTPTAAPKNLLQELQGVGQVAAPKAEGLLGELQDVTKVKEPETFLSGDLLQDVFDIIQAPQFIATGLLTPGISISEALEKKISPSQVFNIENPVAAFAVDVIADPLNALGIGGLTKIGTKALKRGEDAATLAKAAQKGERALITLDVPFIQSLQGVPIVKGTPIFENLTKLGNKIEQLPGASKVKRAFKLSPATPKLQNIDEIEEFKQGVRQLMTKTDEAKAIQRFVSSQTLDFAKTLDKGLDSLIRSKQITPDDVQSFATKLNDPQQAAEIPEILNDLYNTAKKKTDQLGIIWKASGGGILEGKVLPNVPVKETRDFLKSKAVKPLSARKFGGKAPSDISPKYFKLGDDVVVKEGRRAFDLETGKLFKQKKVGQYTDEAGNIFKPTAVTPAEINPVFEKLGIKLRFAEDAPLQIATMGVSVAKKQAAAKFIDGIKELGKEIGDAKLPAGMAKSTLKELDNFAFPAEFVPIIDSTFNKYSNIESVNDIIKAYDKVLNLWKGASTFVIPAFHTRNMVSNMWQLFLGGTNFKHMPKALRIQKAFTKARETGDDLSKFLKGDDLKVANEFREKGLGGIGWLGADVEKELRGLNENFVFELGGKTGAFLEDWSKLTMYLDRRAKGFPVDRAALDVKKFLFDYSELTEFERNFLKRIFPFYTWTRKNIPLQVAMLIQNPAKVSVIDKARKAIESQVEGEKLDEKLIPEWLKQGYPIFLGDDPEGLKRFFNLSGFLPTIDLEQIFNPADTTLSNISPFFKTPLELISNYDFYYQRQISDFPGQRKEFLGVDLPPGLIKILKSVRPVGEAERIRSAFETGQLPEALVKLIAGAKVQEIDPGTQEFFFGLKQAETIRSIEKDLKKAETTGDAEEVLRLQNLLDDARAGIGIENI